VAAVTDVTAAAEETGMAVRVLLVDDDALVRAGLSMMLHGSDNIVIVGEAEDGDQVPAAVARHEPDVVLMDLRMPRVGGITATRRLRGGPRPPEVIVLTTFDADENVLSALRAGASGFLLKDSPPAEIAASLVMSVATVKAHVTHILTKIGLSNRTQIAILAHDAGLA
jgi:DNA-binding NarL/FixJ family response regulator